MDLEKVYHDMDGNKCNILHLVKHEPAWAANLIQHYETRAATSGDPVSSAAPDTQSAAVAQIAAEMQARVWEDRGVSNEKPWPMAVEEWARRLRDLR